MGENRRKLIIGDGAMGTLLMRAGLAPGMAPESWNLENPSAVESIHAAYLEAGCRLIETNSFGANRAKLERYRLGKRVREINFRAASIARRVARTKALVAGSIGPTGELMEPWGALGFEDAYDIFAEQAEALADGGVDLIMVETMTDVQEARAAVLAAKDITGLPVVAQMSFEPSGRTLMGTSPQAMAVVLASLGAEFVGSNCGVTPDQIGGIIRAVGRLLAPCVSAVPNAGVPPIAPNQMPEPMMQLAEEGASILGGCCGTTPDHMRLVVEEAISRGYALPENRAQGLEFMSLLREECGARGSQRREVLASGYREVVSLWRGEGTGALMIQMTGAPSERERREPPSAAGAGTNAEPGSPGRALINLIPEGLDWRRLLSNPADDGGSAVAFSHRIEDLDRALAFYAGRACVFFRPSGEDRASRDRLRTAMNEAKKFGCLALVERGSEGIVSELERIGYPREWVLKGVPGGEARPPDEWRAQLAGPGAPARWWEVVPWKHSP